MTAASNCTTSARPPSHVGHDPTPHEASNEVSAGVCACGPAVSASCYDNPAANAAAFRKGWFRIVNLGLEDDETFSISSACLGHLHFGQLETLSVRDRGRSLTHPA